MADERVRRALAHAIDSAALVAAAPGVDLAAGRGGAIPPVMPGHGDGAGLAYDLERARELLAEAGFPGGDGLSRAAHRRAPVVADRRARRAARRDRRPRALRDARRSGSASRRRRTRGSPAGTPTTPTRTASTSACSSSSMPFYRDEETNDDPRAGRASRATATSGSSLYREFERIWIGERAAIVPISYSRQLVLRRPNVHGLRLNPMGAFHLEQVVVDPLRDALSVSCGS